jgi:protein TonB
MLAYASQNPRPAGRAGSPKALVLIVAGHAALIAAVMAAKMEIIPITPSVPPTVITIPPEKVPPPEPEPRTPQEPQLPQTTFIDHVPPIVPVETMVPNVPIDIGPAIPPLPPAIGSGGGGIAADPPKPAPVKIGAISRTPESALRPPYPNDKLRLEQEATLKLRLTIDARGRVTAVDPVGAADPSFLEAARRHIIRAWRYKPATEDGVAVPSTMIINLSFRLEQA